VCVCARVRMRVCVCARGCKRWCECILVGHGRVVCTEHGAYPAGKLGRSAPGKKARAPRRTCVEQGVKDQRQEALARALAGPVLSPAAPPQRQLDATTPVPSHLQLLYDTFSAFGVIVSTPKIMRDPETGNSRGFGFVSFDCFEVRARVVWQCGQPSGQALGGRAAALLCLPAWPALLHAAAHTAPVQRESIPRTPSSPSFAGQRRVHRGHERPVPVRATNKRDVCF